MADTARVPPPSSGALFAVIVAFISIVGTILLGIIAFFLSGTFDQQTANTVAINDLKVQFVEEAAARRQNNLALLDLQRSVEKLQREGETSNRLMAEIATILDRLRKNSDRMNEWRQQYNRDRKEGDL